jgi:two-component system sensor histidine kinase ArlS
VYYFSYYVFINGESRIFNARINLFLTQQNIRNRDNNPMKIERFKELYVLNKINGKVLQDPYNIGKIDIDRKITIKKIDNEYILFFVRRNYIIGYPVTNSIKVLEILKKILIVFFILSSITSFIISYFLAQKSLEPIKNINKRVSEINVSNLDKRLKVVKNGDEINELSIHLNKMLERLERGFESQNQFINDVSHELRTPLTNFIGYVQLLKRWGYKDEEILKESLEKLEKTSFYMKDLVEKLLQLSKDIEITNKITINVNQKIKSMAKNFKKIYKDFEFKVIEKNELLVDTEEKYLDILLNILVENAVKYSKDIKKIEFIIDESSVTIKDYGIGMDNTEKIFDRFYREEPSRNKKIPGFGIGLSIAKKITEALNMDIKVLSVKGKGSEFKLIFKDL